MRETREVLAEIHTSEFKIIGNVHVSMESYRGRLVDRLNMDGHRFIPITGARLTPIEGGEDRVVDVILVNADDVTSAIPIEE